MGDTELSSAPVARPLADPEDVPAPMLKQSTSIRASVRDFSRARRKPKAWYLPSRIVDHLVHVNPVGKFVLACLAFLPVVDYGKDLYVLIHLAETDHMEYFVPTLIVMIVSLRLMLLALSDPELKAKQLLYTWIPGSVFFESPTDTWLDVGVCLMWEVLILVGVPFTPFFLLYIAIRKAMSLFSGRPFRNDHALGFGVIELFFETIPQTVLQAVIYFLHKDDPDHPIQFEVLELGLILGTVCLIRLPIIVWFNRRIIHRLNFKRRHNATVSSVAFLQDGDEDIIATGSWDGTVIIHRILDGQFIKAKRCIPMGYPVNDVKFAPDSSIIGVAGYVIELFDWKTGKFQGQIPRLDSHQKTTREGRLKKLRSWTVRSFDWSSGGKYIAAAMGTKVVIYDPRIGEKKCEVKAQERGHGEVLSVAFSPAGNVMATGGYEQIIRLWHFDEETGMLGAKSFQTLSGHSGVIMSLCWGPCRNQTDRYYIVSGADDGTARLWDPSKEDPFVHAFEGHSKEVTAVAFSHNGWFIASGSRDRSVRLWNVETKVCEKIFVDTHEDMINCLAIGPYDDIIVSGSEDQSTRLYKLSS